VEVENTFVAFAFRENPVMAVSRLTGAVTILVAAKAEPTEINTAMITSEESNSSFFGGDTLIINNPSLALLQSRCKALRQPKLDALLSTHNRRRKVKDHEVHVALYTSCIVRVERGGADASLNGPAQT
jgi:hypothetical protein